MNDTQDPAGDDVPTRRAGGRSNASLERENTALELESGELKAHQVVMERRADVNRALLEASADENAVLELESDELKAHKLILERQADVNRALLDASVDGIRLVDLDGRTLLANSVIEHLARDVFRVPEEATLQEGSAIAQRLTNSESFLATMEAISVDPECATQDSFELRELGRSFERRTGPVRDVAGELIGRIIVVREVTAEREAERLKSEITAARDTARVKSELVATISQVNETLEAKVAERTDLAERRAHALARSNAELEQFASVAAHDLQEPLRKIRMYCGRVELRRDELPEEVQSDIARMEAAAGRMQNLISDLLDLARVNSRGRELVANDLGEVAREVVVDLEAHIADVGASIELE
ncbi:MAG: hypothetical protein QOD65_3786, partial [Gaiellales bacterium]|nr:hypothetical protein [Gaiellales bacterium]